MKSTIHWIEISERKPEPWRYVLVITKHKNMFPLFVERTEEFEDIWLWAEMPTEGAIEDAEVSCL